MCSDCSASRICAGHHRMFNPACIHCGARLIQSIPKFCKTTVEATQRRQAALKTWVEYGHSEQAIRELVAGPMAFAPVTKEGGK